MGELKPRLVSLPETEIKHTEEISQGQVEEEAQVIARWVIAFDNNTRSKSAKEQVSLRRVIFSSYNTCGSTGNFFLSVLRSLVKFGL